MPDVDLSSAARFLDALGGQPQAHTFIVFPEGTADLAPRIRHGTLAELGQLLKTCNDRGGGISVTVAQTDGQGRTLGNMVAPRALFLDLDPEKGSDAAGVPLPNFGRTHWPSAIVRTRRGWHVYWWLAEGQPWEAWEAMQLALARKWGGDLAMLDRTKALRVPGFWHHKAEPPVFVGLRHLAEEPRFSIAELADAFRIDVAAELERMASGRTGEKTPRTRGSRYDPARVSQADRVVQYQSWVADQPPAVSGQGGHDALVRVIKMAWNFGIADWADALPVVEAFNDRCDPPWKEGQLRSQFWSASRGRFDPTSWESMVWVPEPDVVRREGPQIVDDDEAPVPDEPRGGQRRIVREPKEEPDFWERPFDEGPPHPALRVIDGGSPSTIRVRAAAGDGEGERDGRHDYDGGDSDGNGRARAAAEPDDGELRWGGPPVNGHRVLDKDAPLESARMFVRWKHVAGDVKTIGTYRRSWYRWDGQRYEELSPARVNKTIYAFASPARQQKPGKNGRPRLVPFNPDSKKVNNIRHALESLTFLDDALRPPCWIAPPGSIDGRDLPQPPPKEIVCCRNGLLHLPTRAFLGPRPDFFNFTALGVDYDPNAAAPTRWLRFLEELWEDDRDSHRLLQEWFGLCLVADTSYQKALLIVGPKRCGKGTIARTLNRLHGERNSVAWPRLSDLIARFGLQDLLDKTVAIIPDMRVSAKIDTVAAVELFLSITGEDWVQVDRKNLGAVTTQLPVRFMVMSNEAPRVSDPSGAFASRILALRCVQSFLGAEDLELEAKLAAELPGILRWSIEGWERLTQRGRFVQPGTAAELVQEVTELSAPVQTFVADRCALEVEASTGTDDLFIAWRRWCEQEGRSAVGEKSTFVRNLRAAFPQLYKIRPKSDAGTRLRALSGIRLLPADEEPERRPYQRDLQDRW